MILTAISIQCTEAFGTVPSVLVYVNCLFDASVCFIDLVLVHLLHIHLILYMLIICFHSRHLFRPSIHLVTLLFF